MFFVISPGQKNMKDSPKKWANKQVISLNSEFSGEDVGLMIGSLLKRFRNKIIFSTSLGAEDQVLTSLIAGKDASVPIITLDTGRLFPEAYELIESTEKRYGIRIEILFPDADKVKQMVNEKWINLFYQSVENRKLCCRIRKKEPLAKRLKGYDVWITGLRRGQSATREENHLADYDPIHDMIKINPLIDWTTEQIWDFIRKHKIPYNTLHNRGFPSIGCQPCTRAILPGEDIRAGRWWWETGKKECGIHER